MTDQNPGFQLSRLHPVGARLTEHLQDCSTGPVKIVRCRGISPGRLRQSVLQIRQIYLDTPFQQPQGVGLFISAAVPHHGYRPGHVPQGLQNDRREMGGRHQVQACGTQVHQLLKNFPQVRGSQGFSYAALGDRPVLAEAAAKIAAGKKYRSGAVYTHKTWLFPPVEHGPGGHWKTGLAADAAGTALRPFRAALPGTKTADHGASST